MTVMESPYKRRDKRATAENGYGVLNNNDYGNTGNC